jgi:NAD(P)-dependent dehydrogenase (short-subunit alcohol dehydrogenase family)
MSDFDGLTALITGIARVTRAALPHLRRSRHAAVVNMCSAVAFVGVRQRALYAASKGAVLGLTLAMAADHVADGIRVTAVAAGNRRHAVGGPAALCRRGRHRGRTGPPGPPTDWRR